MGNRGSHNGTYDTHFQKLQFIIAQGCAVCSRFGLAVHISCNDIKRGDSFGLLDVTPCSLVDYY
jgi:hypothetical protein